MSRQWRELCEKRPDLYLYEPSEDDLRYPRYAGYDSSLEGDESCCVKGFMKPDGVMYISDVSYGQQATNDYNRWLGEIEAQREYQSWLEVLDQQHRR